HRCAVRAAQAAPEPRGDRAADEALHLHGRGHWRDAGGDVRDHDPDRYGMSEQRLPPVTAIGMTSLALIVAGGIYLASHILQHVLLVLVVVLLALSAALLVTNFVLLLRVRGFARARFFQVAKWALLAYAITAGMILYAFLRDG